MIKIWEEEEKKNEYFIALRYDDDGNIKMCVVDRHGDFVEGGNILMLRKTGVVTRFFAIHPNISESLGLCVDNCGSIKISE